MIKVDNNLFRSVFVLSFLSAAVFAVNDLCTCSSAFAQPPGEGDKAQVLKSFEEVTSQAHLSAPVNCFALSAPTLSQTGNSYSHELKALISQLSSHGEKKYNEIPYSVTMPLTHYLNQRGRWIKFTELLSESLSADEAKFWGSDFDATGINILSFKKRGPDVALSYFSYLLKKAKEVIPFLEKVEAEEKKLLASGNQSFPLPKVPNFTVEPWNKLENGSKLNFKENMRLSDVLNLNERWKALADMPGSPLMEDQKQILSTLPEPGQAVIKMMGYTLFKEQDLFRLLKKIEDAEKISK